ncbi:MAG: hypothetical protein Q8Q46_02115 [Candidatus Giovannonibacteria bacterium]|nr:hypothetical protein [Candidatus Giovannonibacteria bacterium]
MKESFQPSESPEKEKGSLWQTFRDMKNAVAFAALLAFAAPGITSAQEKETRPEGTKISDTERGIEKIKEDVLKIAESLKIKGREGKFGQTATRRWVSENKEVIVAGYENDGKARWIILENENAQMRFFDMSADGSVNRVIINDEKSPAGRKATDNDIKTFVSMDKLAKDARVSADLMPEKAHVYELGKENNEIILRGVDFEKGESEKVIGPEAKKLAERVQNLFNAKVAQHSAELAK